jgi:hypothetical protein
LLKGISRPIELTTDIGLLPIIGESRVIVDSLRDGVDDAIGRFRVWLSEADRGCAEEVGDEGLSKALPILSEGKCR